MVALHIFGRLLNTTRIPFQEGLIVNREQELAEQMSGSSDYVQQQLRIGENDYTVCYLECLVEANYIQDEGVI